MKVTTLVTRIAAVYSAAAIGISDPADSLSPPRPDPDPECALSLNTAGRSSRGSGKISVREAVEAFVDSPFYSWAIANPELVFKKILAKSPGIEPTLLWETVPPAEIADTLVRFFEAVLRPDMFSKGADERLVEWRTRIATGAGLTVEELGQTVEVAQWILRTPSARDLLTSILELDTRTRWSEILKEKKARELFRLRPLLTLRYRILDTLVEEPDQNEAEVVALYGEGLVARHDELLERFYQLGAVLRTERAWAPLLERIQNVCANYRAEEVRLLLEQLSTRRIAMTLLLREVARLRDCIQILEGRLREGARFLVDELETVEAELQSKDLDRRQKMDLEQVRNIYSTRSLLFGGMLSSLTILHEGLTIYAISVSDLGATIAGMTTKLSLTSISSPLSTAAVAEIQDFGKRLRSILDRGPSL